MIDTETTTDMMQQLRFGIAHLWRLNSAAPPRPWVFYDPQSLAKSQDTADQELRVLRQFADTHGAMVLTVDEFVDTVFLKYVYKLKVTCIGANLAFDLSRIAHQHYYARSNMAGGFGLRMARNLKPSNSANVIVKSLGNRKTLFQFTKVQGDLSETPTYRGDFVDVLQFANALYAGNFGLASLSHFLKTEHRKKEGFEAYDGSVTAEFLDYCWHDVLATYECFLGCRAQWLKFGLTQTDISRVYSGASVAKGILKEAGKRPLRETQPEFFTEHADIVGKMMQGFIGGRVEPWLRNTLAEGLYADMTSMYPTVSTLMGLDHFLIASKMSWYSAKGEVQRLLDDIARRGVDALADKAIWKQIIGIAKIRPHNDRLPTRIGVTDEDDAGIDDNIVLSRVESALPTWYAIPDLVVSCLHEHKAPRVLEAWKFVAGEPQQGLQLIRLPGGITIDPYAANLFRRIIEERQLIKGRMEGLSPSSSEYLELATAQYMLKILANAGGYGIFVELVEHRLVRPKGTSPDTPDGDLNETNEGPLKPHWNRRICYSGDEAFVTEVSNEEELGRYFHPLIGVMITSAARLMLACAEVCATRTDWPDQIIPAYCDTDAWIFARPEGMDREAFHSRVNRITTWFEQINPYDPAIVKQLFKMEGDNFDPNSKGELLSLYLYAISSKRYALFNIGEDGHPVIRKASSHGLGYLMPPYANDFEHPNLPPLPEFILNRKLPEGVKHHGELLRRELNINRWQHDFWWTLIDCIMLGYANFHDRLKALPCFDEPAMTRYAVRTPTIDKLLEPINRGKPYRQWIRPGGFLSTWLAEPAYINLFPNLALPQEFHSKQTEKQYRKAVKSHCLTEAEIEIICQREPEGWSMIGPFSPRQKWRFRDAINKADGLPIPPWIHPGTYAGLLCTFPERSERKFLTGYADGLMEVPTYVLKDRNYIGKATNRLDEAQIPSLSVVGDTVNEYVSINNRHVPAHRARELLSPLLSGPASKAIAEAEREQAQRHNQIHTPIEGSISEDRLVAMQVIDQLSEFRRTAKPWTVEQFQRETVNYLLTDFGSKTIKAAAADLSTSKTYLIDVVSGRWKQSAVVPLAQIIADRLSMLPPSERAVLPPVIPADDDGIAACEDAIGAAEAEQLTDGSAEAFENEEFCRIMIFSDNPVLLLRAHYVPDEQEHSTKGGGEILSREVVNVASMLNDFGAAISGLSQVEVIRQEDDDDDINAEEI